MEKSKIEAPMILNDDESLEILNPQVSIELDLIKIPNF